MKDGELRVPVYLEFRGMSTPVSVSVPGYVMRYLESYAERRSASDGATIYRMPATDSGLPEMRVIPLRRAARMTA